jgi:PAS domain S-box-containing protein
VFTPNAYALPWAIVAATLFALAGTIYARQRASRVAVLFCVTIGLVGIWFIAFAVMFSLRDTGTAAIAARIGLAAVCVLPASIYDFTATALRLRSSRRTLIGAAWIVSAVFFGVALFSRGLVGGIVPHAYGFYPAAGIATIPFLLYFAGMLGTQLIEGVREWRQTMDRKRRRRVATLMISFFIVYFAVLDWLPMFGFGFRPFAFIPVIGFMLVASGTIRRHRFQPITAARASREILDTMADALFVIDAEGRIRVVNHAVHELLGWRDSDLLGRAIDRLEELTGDETISRTLRDLAKRGAIRDQERRLRHADGHSVAVSVSISPIREQDVQEGAVVIARDIRARKRAEEELQSALRHLEQSNRELEDFAYVASHDLQEPLRKVASFCQLLQRRYAGQMDDRADQYIGFAVDGAQRMQRLINDLLAFSRIGRLTSGFTDVDLNRVLQDVKSQLEARLGTDGEIIWSDLPHVEGEEPLLTTLFVNLIGNSLKFRRPDVPPEVRVTAFREHDEWQINVRDNGIGIEAEFADKVFVIFQRLHARDAYEGTGIGLAIVKKIVEYHGGRIWLDLDVPDGTSINFTIPVLPGAPEREPAVEPQKGTA